MSNLQIIIDKIKEIDNCLDAYEYGNLTYDEYKKYNENNIHGNWSLRRRYFHSKPIWESIIQNIFDKLKDTINLIYKEQKHNTKYVDSKKLNMLINDLKYTEKQFKKNTDNCSVYPIKSETIKDNLLYIIAYLENY